MSQYVTIQKFCKDTGVNTSTIQRMVKKGELTPYKKKGLKRVFVDPNEFFKQLKPANDNLDDLDLDRFLI